MKLTFCGGVGEVTGANFLLETNGRKILIDCGMVQGNKEIQQANYKPFPYDPKEVDALLVTHAHIDHIGRIPKLVKDGFQGLILSTAYTKEISPFMLEDSSRLLAIEAEENKIEPLYDNQDAEKSFSFWQTLDYHKEKEIFPGIKVSFKNAGHILGSAIIEIIAEGKCIAFTGDLGNSPSPLLPDAEYVTDADYMVMESVYGDRNHPNTDERRDRLLKSLKEALEKGGTVLVPMFSLEKTQVILHELNYFIENNLITKVPVFLDSPLAIKVTNIYGKAKKEFNIEAQKEINTGDDIFDFPGLELVHDKEESESIFRRPGPKIIIAGSGMSSGGRIVSHERLLLPDQRNTVLFLGYQGAGTLGRELESGVKSVKIYGQTVKVGASISVVEGYSSHKDSDNLLEFVSHSAPKIKKVFVAMGEPKSAMFLTQRIKDYLNIQAIYPQSGKTYDII